MKTVLRLLSLLLVFLMCFGILASCKKNKEGQDTTPISITTTPGQVTHDLDPQDFGGKEFHILDANDQKTMHVNYADTLDGASAVQQKLYERDVYLEQRNNLNITYTQETIVYGKGIEILENSQASQDRICDMVISTASGGRIASLATKGMLADLKSTPVIDLSGTWWSAQMNEAMQLGGKMYFTTGDIAASVYNSPMCVYANKLLLQEEGISDDLYQKVKDGAWTVEYMTELSKDKTKSLNGDGIYDTYNDYFGVVCEQGEMVSAGLLVGMGYNLSYVTSDGSNIVVNSDTQTLGNLCEQLTKLVSPPASYNSGDKVSILTKAFAGDRALFAIHLVEAANNQLKNMTTDYMILPMPKGDTSQQNYRSYINGWVNCFIAVPSYDTSDNDYAHFCGYVIESLARGSYDIVRPVAFDQVVMYQSTRDPGAIEMLEIIFNTLYLDFQGIFDFGECDSYDGANDLIAKVIFKGEGLSSGWKKIEGPLVEQAGKTAIGWLGAGN